jgi:2-polyprenyl-3-methyl-5-hydroxy-6-metoxy-1,4-benzoquinol methylase
MPLLASPGAIWRLLHNDLNGRKRQLQEATMTITIDLSEQDAAQVEAFSGRLFMSGLEALELLSVELGVRLGLYEALAESGPLTSTELATTAGIAERYAREWLEQQAVSGILTVDTLETAAEDRAYALPAAHAHVLLDPDSPANTTALAGFVAAGGRVLTMVADAFRSGGGVPYADYEAQDLQAALARPVFKHALVQEWIPALATTQRRLDAGEVVRVAEIGCGEGLAAVAIATAYPNAQVDGFDIDDASVAAARRHAADAGVADRVRFEVWDASAAERTPSHRYDLVMCIEMLHDTSNPVGILRTMRSLREDTGEVLVVDERVADTFTAPGDEMERFMYAASVLHCLPVGMVDEGSAGTGTVIRADTVRRYASAAGFASVDVLAVEHPQFRLYLLEG